MSEMPQLWRDFLDEVAKRGPLVKRTVDWVCLGWPADKPAQTVQVSWVNAHNLSFIFLTADVCPADVAPTREALELASKVFVGGVIIHKGVLSLRHVFREGTFTRRAFWETVDLLRGNAIRFRERLLPTKDVDALGLFKYVVE